MKNSTDSDYQSKSSISGEGLGRVSHRPAASATDGKVQSHMHGHPPVSGSEARMSLNEYVAYAQKAHGHATDDPTWVVVQTMLILKINELGPGETKAFMEAVKEKPGFTNVPLPLDTLERARAIAFDKNCGDPMREAMKIPRMVFHADHAKRDSAKREAERKEKMNRMVSMHRAGRAKAAAKEAADAKPETIVDWALSAAGWLNARPHFTGITAILALSYLPIFDDEPLAYQAGEAIADATEDFVGLAVLAIPLLFALLILLRGWKRRRAAAKSQRES